MIGAKLLPLTMTLWDQVRIQSRGYVRSFCFMKITQLAVMLARARVGMTVVTRGVRARRISLKLGTSGLASASVEIGPADLAGRRDFAGTAGLLAFGLDRMCARQRSKSRNGF